MAEQVVVGVVYNSNQAHLHFQARLWPPDRPDVEGGAVGHLLWIPLASTAYYGARLMGCA